MHKRIFKLGLIFYFLLGILSIYFFKERTVFTDIAFHLFCIIKDGSFAIQNFRYGALLTQLFPLLTSKLSLSLEGIMISYSLGFILFYSTCYILSGFVFRNYRFSLIILLFSILFTTDTFYWIQSELPQGIAFTLLFFSFLSTQKSDTIKAIPLAILFFSIITIVFYHPLLIFVFTFTVLFLLLSKDDNFDSRLLIASTIFYLGVFLLKKYVFKTEYESNAIQGSNKLVSTFPHYINLYSNKRFLLNCLTEYYWIPICFLSISIVYLFQNKWRKFILFSGFFLGYILLVNVSYPDDSTANFYIENLYLPLSVFLALPLTYDLLPILPQRLAVSVIVLMGVSCILRVYCGSFPYTARLNWERKVLSDSNHQKLAIDVKHTPRKLLQMTWGSPYEFWLLSTTEEKATASIIVSENIESINYALNNSQVFITTWGAFPYAELPKRYFVFKDTTSSYRAIR